MTLFAPGIFSIDGSRDKDITISPSGDEVFFARGKGWPYTKIMHMIKSAGKWSSPDTAFFSKDCWASRPCFSPDGQCLFYSTSKGKSDISHYNLWRIKKNGGKWSEPESVIDIAGGVTMDPRITTNSVYFIYSEFGSNKSDIYVSKNISGVLTAPLRLNYPINTQYSEGGLYVNPDESFMIFVSDRPGRYSEYGDSYISYKKNDGTWTNPKTLGMKYNKGYVDKVIAVSPEGKYLFFYYLDDIYWASAGNIIDSLKHTNFIPYVKNQIDSKTCSAKFPFTFIIPDSIFADDDGNNTLTYSAALSNGKSLPSELSFNEKTKTLSGIIDTSAIFNIIITATDTAKATASAQFTLTIKDPAAVSNQNKKQNFSIDDNANSIDIKKGLVAYYPLNGNSNDESGNKNDGKILGATFAADKFGKRDNALNFNGIDDCVEIENSPTINITGSLSISCWIYPRRAGRWESWISKANNYGTRSQWRFGFGDPAPNSFGLTIWNSDWSDLWTNKKAIPLNTWSHVLLIADQQYHIVFYYLNGELIDTVKINAEFLGSNDHLFIGYQKDDSVFFDGLIDEVRIYNRSLNTEEVNTLFKQFNK